MGIRVNKVIGYGLVDVQYEGYKPADPRINEESLFFDYDAKLDEYLAYLDEHSGDDIYNEAVILRDQRSNPKLRNPDPQSAFTWQPEYGLPNVLLLRPTWMSDWHRRDDSIDYVEETSIREPLEENGDCYVDVIRHGIYPYNGSYMDSRTGLQVNQEIMTFIRITTSVDPVEGDFLRAADLIAHHCGFRDYADAVKFLAPTVPDEIKTLAKYGNLFTDDDVWKQLRPMRYVYWS